MTLRSSAALVALCLAAAPSAGADYAYDGKKRAASEAFAGAACAVRLNGQSEVAGTYSDKGGTLEVWCDGGSELAVSGEAAGVVVMNLNGGSTLDLRRLKVGAGGVVVRGLDGGSRLRVGECAGPIDVRSGNGGSTIEHGEGAKVEGAANLKGGSKAVVGK